MPTFRTIHFNKGSVFLTPFSKRQLDIAVTTIKKYPSRKIAISVLSQSCEFCYQVTWDRIVSVMIHLQLNGINKKQLLFNYNDSGTDNKIVTLTGSKENRPNMVSARYPSYSYHKLTKYRCSNEPGHTVPKE